MEKRVLVAYYTHSGNTKKLAEMIARETNGDLLAIEPEAPYPTAYQAVVDQAKREIKDGYHPPLKEIPGTLDDYDTIFVGTPNWWSTVAPPVAAFVKGAALSGKTIIPFCTHGGGGEARCFLDIAKLCASAEVLGGFCAYGDSAKESDVKVWLRKTGDFAK